jgi:methionyl-tRNA synthetase
VKLKFAAKELLRLSQRVNQYLNERGPWMLVKTDPPAAATTMYVALQSVDWLKTLWSPIVPHSSQQVHELLGYAGFLFGRQYTEVVKDARGEHLVLRYDHTLAAGRWEPTTLPSGQRLREPAPLYTKLDDTTPDQEAAGGAHKE